MGFSRQENWSELPCPPPGNLPNPETEPMNLHWQADSLPVVADSLPLGKPLMVHYEAITVLDLHASGEIASKIHLCKAKMNRIIRRA